MKKYLRSDRYVKLFFVLFSLSTALNPLFSQWVQSNGPYWGEVNCFAGSENVIYAGTQGDSWAQTNGSLFRSTNNGANWTRLIIWNFDCYAVAVIGNNIFAAGSPGLYRSADNGANWTQVNISKTTALAVSGTNLIAGFDNGIHRSTDNGNSWVRLCSTYSPVFTLTVSGTNIYAGLLGTVYFSTDNGSTWTAPVSPLASSNSSVNAIVANAASDGSSGIYFLAGTSDGIFRSTDNGTSWNPISSGISFMPVWSFMVVGKNVIAGSDSGLFISTNDGKNWAPMEKGLTSSSVRALAVNGNTLFAGTYYEGVYRSQNNGATWIAASSGMERPVIHTLTVLGSDLFAGSEIGLYKSSFDGESWTSTNEGAQYPYSPITSKLYVDVNSLLATDTSLYAASTAGLLRLSNNNNKWLNVVPVMIFNRLAGMGTTLFMSNYNSAIRMNEKESDWKQVYTVSPSGYVTDIAVKGENVFVSEFSMIKRSSDRGLNWVDVSPAAIRILGFRTFAVNGSDIYAGTVLGDVYRSTDNGTTWTISVRATGAEDGIHAFAFSGSNIFIGTDGGVYTSNDNGVKWTSTNNGLTDSIVNSLVIKGSNLFAGTSKGVYRRPLSEMTRVGSYANEIPSVLHLEQNYPNPFNPSTKIEFTIPSDGHVQLTVFNSIGQEITTLYNGEAKAGTNHQVLFNANTLSSGLYFSRLEFNGQVHLKKMLLIK